jgi:hypothetical protein
MDVKKILGALVVIGLAALVYQEWKKVKKKPIKINK